MKILRRTDRKKDWNRIAETYTVVMLGMTALLTAWAGWIGSLHGGNQETNYTTSNNLASEGNALYNESIQRYHKDVMLWNDIFDMQQEVYFAQKRDDKDTLEQVCQQLLYKLYLNITPEMAEKVGWNYDLSDEEFYNPTQTVVKWLEDERSMHSPLSDADFVDEYFHEAQSLLEQSQEALEQGKKDNSNSDAYGLVTVIYSVVLFLLGIAGNLHNSKSKCSVILIATAAFFIATVYMVMLPMPTGFKLLNYL